MLSGLSTDAFSGLSSLRILLLYRINLSTLPDNVFNGLTNLHHLRVDGNNLNSLPSGIFSGLANLHILELHDNSLSSLPTGILSVQSDSPVPLKQPVEWTNPRFERPHQPETWQSVVPSGRLRLDWLNAAVAAHLESLLPSCASAVPEERAALVAFYEATGGANWSNSGNWLTDEQPGTVTTDESVASRLV